MAKNKIEWQTPEFEYYQKTKSWFLITGCIGAGLFLWAIFSKNFLFALLILLSYFSLSVYAFKKPKKIKVAVSHKGVQIDQALYDYDSLKSFWIFYDPPEIKELSLRSKKTIMPYVKIPLVDENPVEIRKILIKYLKERKHKESTIDNLARQIRY